MLYKAIIFDLDGTLLDTLDDLADACNRVLLAAGFPGHPVDSYRYFVGDGLQSLVARILPEDRRDERHVQMLTESFRGDYGRNWKVKTRLYSGIASMLDRLQENTVALNVLSNKPHDFTEACVRDFFGSWKFQVILGQRPGMPRKPDPAGALEISSTLQVAPCDVLYLGDTATDMKTARAAGMFAVGALWGFREADELLQNGAQRLVQTPGELIDFLGSRV